MINEVLKFWFEEIDPKQWWAVDTAFDTTIKDRFGEVLAQAAAGELHSWRIEPRGRLAEIIVLDQFSRNIFRGTARAFAQDAMSLVLAQEAVAIASPEALTPKQRPFLIMPYMHSESAVIHIDAVRLFEEFAPDNLDFEIRHKAIIDRFGRYPHRNAILARDSTPQEIEFLKEPGSSF